MIFSIQTHTSSHALTESIVQHLSQGAPQISFSVVHLDAGFSAAVQDARSWPDGLGLDFCVCFQKTETVGKSCAAGESTCRLFL